MATIFIFGSYAPSLINFRGDLIHTWHKKGHTVIAAAPYITPMIRAQLNGLGAFACNCPLSRTGKKPLNDLASIGKLLNIFKKYKPDYYLGYTIKPNIYGSLAARMADIPSIFSMVTGSGRVFGTDNSQSSIFQRLLLMLYKLAIFQNSGVFFQNPEDEQLFRNRGILGPNTKTTIINGSGVNTNYFSQRPIPSDISFLMAARLIEEKGIRYYYRAAKIIKKKFPQIRFLLAGWIDGSESAIKKTELNEWEEDGSIDYLGHLDDIRPALERASVFVLPTYYREGVPRSILEAMATGRPIITTDIPGCRSTVIHRKNGILIRPQNDDDLVQAIRVFIDNPNLISQMGIESRKRAIEQFDVHRINQEICDFMGL